MTGSTVVRAPGPPKAGWQTKTVPIWTRTAQAAQPAQAPAEEPSDPIKEAQAAGEAAKNRQVESYPAAAAPAQTDPTSAAAPAQSDPTAGLATQYQQQMASLQQLMIQQQTQYHTQMAEAQRQQAAAMAQAAESARQAEAMQRAFVPNLEPTATAPSLGDTREGSGTRTAAANTLSNLAILTGINGAASAGVGATSSLAGLQIA